MKRKVVVAITGASGSVYPSRLLSKFLQIKDQWEAIGVVVTNNAKEVWQVETGTLFKPEPAFSYFAPADFNAPFASGSARFDTMIVIPCSMGVLGRIASGISNDLITRAADVILKERRKLICVVRETPYSLIHIKNMEYLTLAGGIVCPATPSYYSKPQTIGEVADTVVDRVLDLAGFDIPSYRWGK
ncbi:UbiX family flavin prenyltransferase [Niabella drilacis]|uniref:Flavin prenyltransferase UbiX n=1 Tax=Niabella drilacis (strain DSM 25811 / CCM 8410 / CCUG 62505 / LMG 26954 / E90) TaxID=1285928 RepID=A0A1G6ZXI1_NIADE|nr:UbiX family flavin prenyltransferase [Niabella drilacis]SDE07269.1 4-hydroxy-3-polyprenylbenzoate decarboxylase [Niabella drilacis]